MLRKFEYKLLADYFQFYLQDESADGDLSDAWTPEAVDRLLAIAPGIAKFDTRSLRKVAAFNLKGL